MKYLPYVVIAVLILFIVFRPARVEHVSGEVVRDTVTVIDTVRDTVPKPYRVEVMRMDTFYLPIFVGDSLEVDSVPVVFSVLEPVLVSVEVLCVSPELPHPARLPATITVASNILRIFFFFIQLTSLITSCLYSFMPYGLLPLIVLFFYAT